MALLEGCKHSLEISIPAEVVAQETERIVDSFRNQAQLPGFRPGKVPASMVRERFKAEIRQELLESLIPKALREEIKKDNLPLVGSPDIKDLHFEPGEPLKFTAEFEVSPEVELGEYVGVTVNYQEPEVTEEDVDKRLEQLREQKAEYLNVDPRPVAEGDFAVVALKSLSEIEGQPIEQDELMLHVGGDETLPDFSANLAGMEPGQEKEFDVSYPEDYGQERISGRDLM